MLSCLLHCSNVMLLRRCYSRHSNERAARALMDAVSCGAYGENVNERQYQNLRSFRPIGAVAERSDAPGY